MHHPKFYKSLGVSYAFDPTPGRHTTANLDMYGAGLLAKGGLFEGLVFPRKFKRPGEDRDIAGKMQTGIFQFTNSIGLC